MGAGDQHQEDPGEAGDPYPGAGVHRGDREAAEHRVDQVEVVEHPYPGVRGEAGDQEVDPGVRAVVEHREGQRVVEEVLLLQRRPVLIQFWHNRADWPDCSLVVY